MKTFKILSLMLMAIPMFTACGTSYNVTVVLEKDNNIVYDNGRQEVTFNIKDKDASEYGLGFASSLDSSCVETNSYFAGKTLSFERLSDTSLKVSFDGDSTYAFGDAFQVEFTFKFLDKAFNKNGFHDYGNPLYLTRSYAEIDSTASAGTRGAFSFKVYGTTLKNAEVSVDSLVCSGVTATEVKVYESGTIFVKYEDKADNATVKFPASLFNNNKGLTFTIDQLVILKKVAFAA